MDQFSTDKTKKFLQIIHKTSSEAMTPAIDDSVISKLME